ncbi:MAG: molybdopterin-dependent oxidoreductase [Burkholderiaceae bacterium]|nr:molybdopterin-dependent oxidoreductase [Burkholderiaceae bacterium]
MSHVLFKLMGRRWLVCGLLGVCMLAAHAFELPKTQPKGAIILTVNGKIGIKNSPDAAVFDAAMLDALPQISFTTRTPWDKEPVKFTGPLLKDILQALKAKGVNLKAVALNDYKINIPFDDAFKYDVILARQMDGKVIGVRDKGPLFVMYPFEAFPQIKTSTYYSRCIWQLKSITVE